jgi:hypothetical protein
MFALSYLTDLLTLSRPISIKRAVDLDEQEPEASTQKKIKVSDLVNLLSEEDEAATGDALGRVKQVTPGGRKETTARVEVHDAKVMVDRKSEAMPMGSVWRRPSDDWIAPLQLDQGGAHFMNNCIGLNYSIDNMPSPDLVRTGVHAETGRSCNRAPSVSDESSAGPVTPPSVKRPHPADLHDADGNCHLDAAATLFEGVKRGGDQISKGSSGIEARPVKRFRALAGSVGLVVLGAALGSVGTIAGLMQLAPEM